MRACVVCFVLASVASVARAQPFDWTLRKPFGFAARSGEAGPFELDAVIEPLPDPPPQVELALHVGVAHATQSYAYYDADPGLVGPHGTGLAFDASAALRVKPWLSVAAVGAVSSIADPSFVDDYDNHVGVTDKLVEVGARGRLHLAGAFVGATAGIGFDRRAFDWQGLRADSSHWLTGFVIGVEAGYRGATRDGFAPELVLGADHWMIPQGDGVAPMWPASAAITTVRASAGVVF